MTVSHHIADYTVTGMTCEHCVAAVKSEVGELPGVSNVDVDLSRGQLTVTSHTVIPTADVVAAVDEAGYAATPERGEKPLS